MNQELFNEITKHLIEDENPSLYLNSIKKQGRLNGTLLEKLAMLESIEQQKEHHPEGNVWIHTMLVVDEAAKIRSESKDKEVFMWAALMHDLGKLVATRKIKGKWRAYNHDVEGGKITKEILENTSDDVEFTKGVEGLVRWHMQPLFVLHSLPYANVSEMKKSVDLREVALLEIADRLGRGPIDMQKRKRIYKEMNIFLERCGCKEKV